MQRNGESAYSMTETHVSETRRIPGVSCGNWISGWVTLAGDIVHGYRQTWGHHPDLLASNPWLLKEAGIADADHAGVITAVTYFDNATMGSLARRGLFSFAVEADGKLHFDSMPPAPARLKVEAFVASLLPPQTTG